MKKIISIIAYSALPILACAQINSTVEVENTYTPTIKDANKITVQPIKKETAIKHYDINYDYTLTPATQFSFSPMWAANSDATIKGAKKGYAHFGYGNNGNLTGKFSYLYDITDNDRLSFNVQTQGYNSNTTRIDKLTEKKLGTGFGSNEKWKSRIYNTNANINYEHKFNAASSLLLDASFGNMAFNYQPTDFPMPDYSKMITDKQRNNTFGFNATLTPYQIGKWQIGGALGYEGFMQAHPATYNLTGTATTNIFDKKLSENAFMAGFNLGYNIAQQHFAGLDFKVGSENYSPKWMKSYTTFYINPYYTYSIDNFNLRLGVNISQSTGYSKDFHIAPDVLANYRINNQTSIFAAIGGGETPNSLRRLTSITPYWRIVPDMQLKHQFDQLDIKIGAQYAPTASFNGCVALGFDMQENRPEVFVSGITNGYNNTVAPYYNNFYNNIITRDGNLFYGELKLNYNYTDRVRISGRNRFNFWGYDHSDEQYDYYASTRFHPVVDLDYSAKIRVYKTLNVDVDFILQNFKKSKINNLPEPETRVELGGGLSYTFEGLPVDITLFGKCHSGSLTGSRYDLYYGYKSQGFNFLGGAALSF